MKRFLVLIIVLLISCISVVNAQVVDSLLPLRNDLYTIEEILKVDSISKTELYNRTLKWVALNYNSSNEVLQLRDSIEGELIGKGLTKTTCHFSRIAKPITIEYTFDILCKNNRIKVIYNRFVVTIHNNINGLDYPYTNSLELYDMKEKDLLRVHKSIKSSISQSLISLKNSIVNGKDEEW